MKFPFARMAAALSISFFSISAHSLTIPQLDSSFAITCGGMPVNPCAKNYWYWSIPTAYNDALQFENNYQMPQFQQWCAENQSACFVWALQWSAAEAGRDHAYAQYAAWNY